MTKRALTYLVSADYARRTGGWAYNEQLLGELVALGWCVERIELPVGFPAPDAAARAGAARLYAALGAGALALSDQICVTPIADIIRAHALRLKLAIIVHHPMALEGAHADSAIAAQERETLRHVRLAIATSETTAETLVRDYGVAPERIIAARPGMEAKPRTPIRDRAPLHLISIGAVVPRKGHDLLIAALALLAHLPWRLSIIGNLTRARQHVSTVRGAITQAGIVNRVTLAGEIDDDALDALWADADLYVSASRHEGYGMAVAEALARGVAIVTTQAGATGRWLPPGAALVAEDSRALSLALERALNDPALRRALSEAGLKQAAALPTWAESGAIVSAALQAL